MLRRLSIFETEPMEQTMTKNEAGMPRGWTKAAELEYRTVCDGVVYVIVKGFSRKYEAWFRGEKLGQTPTRGAAMKLVEAKLAANRAAVDPMADIVRQYKGRAPDTRD